MFLDYKKKIKKLETDIKNIIDIRNLYKLEEEENYYKPVRVANFWNNKYIEYKRKGNRNKAISIEE